MARGATDCKLVPYYTTVAARQPSAGDMETGEIALNLTDKKMYSKDGSGNIVEIGGGTSSGLDINGLSAITSLADGDYVPTYQASSSSNKKFTLSSLVEYLRSFFSPRFRIGDILETTNTVNPGDTVANGGLGYGTWALYGIGRMTICLDSNDTAFDAIDKTDGAKTFNNSHTHSTPALTHSQATTSNTTDTAHAGQYVPPGTGVPISLPVKTHSAHSHTVDVSQHDANTSGSAGSATQSILNPYIVVYRYRRTA